MKKKKTPLLKMSKKIIPYFRPMHARAPAHIVKSGKVILEKEGHVSPALKGKNASRGQSLRKREGLNVCGSSQ